MYSVETEDGTSALLTVHKDLYKNEISFWALYGLDRIPGAFPILGPGIWLGGNDEVTEGQFIWLPSGRLVIFDDWGKNQPDNGVRSAQNCMVYFCLSQEWHDAACGMQGIPGLICESWYRDQYGKWRANSVRPNVYIILCRCNWKLEIKSNRNNQKLHSENHK